MMMRKCVIIGDRGEDCQIKSRLIQTFVTGKYHHGSYTVTDSYVVNMSVNGKDKMIEILDTTGQEEFESLRKLSYHNVDIFLVCFSVASFTTFENVKRKWAPEVSNFSPTIPIILVGTEIELRAEKGDAISFEHGENLAKEISAICYLECSAKTQEGLNEVFNQVALRIPSRTQSPSKRLLQSFSSFRKYLQKEASNIDLASICKPPRKKRKICEDILLPMNDETNDTCIPTQEQLMEERRRQSQIIQLERELQIACYEKDLQKVEFLLKYPEININQGNDYGFTPLIFASKEGHTEIVKMLLSDPRIDVNLGDKTGKTAFYWACYLKRTRIVRLLLSNPLVDVNRATTSGFTSLMAASFNGDIEIVKLMLIKREVDVWALDKCEKTALDYTSHPQIIKILESRAA